MPNRMVSTLISSVLLGSSLVLGTMPQAADAKPDLAPQVKQTQADAIKAGWFVSSSQAEQLAEQETEPVAPINEQPQETAEVLQYLSKRQQKLQFCGDIYEPKAFQQYSTVYPVAENQFLVEGVCFLAAYQSAIEYWSYQKTAAGIEVQHLPLDSFYPDASGTFFRSRDRGVGGLASFDQTRQSLTVYSKGRGLGDCGAFAIYQWTGIALELTEYRYQECTQQSAENYVEPENYPLVYPAMK